MTAFLSSIRTRRGHFAFESGHHSDVWMDLETLCVRPAGIRPFAEQLAGRLRPYQVDAVCGPLNEGAFVALMVAEALGCDFTYAERFVRADLDALYPVEYRLPKPLRPIVHGRRVGIVNDVISAGSAVRGALADLDGLGAQVVAVGSLLVLGDAFVTFARERGLPLAALERQTSSLWTPADCPLCRAGVPLDPSDF